MRVAVQVQVAEVVERLARARLVELPARNVTAQALSHFEIDQVRRVQCYQARVEKMEKGEASIDLLILGLLAAGASRKEIAKKLAA